MTDDPLLSITTVLRAEEDITANVELHTPYNNVARALRITNNTTTWWEYGNATDTPPVIAKKLAQFRQEYAQVLADMQEAYGPSNGYRPNSLTGGARTTQQGLPAADVIAAELERRRTLGGR